MPEGYRCIFKSGYTLLICPNGDTIACDTFHECVQEAYNHRREMENNDVREESSI